MSVLLALGVSCGAKTDTATSTEPETDTDTDTDTDACSSDSGGGIPLLWYAGDAEVIEGELASGHFGADITSRRYPPEFDPSRSLCWNVGTWNHSGEAVPGCPDCAWSFQLTVSDTLAESECCAQYGRVGGEWDGFTGSWGATDSYDYVYGGYVFHLELVLWYYFSGYGWSFFAYNYAGYGYNAGTAVDLEFHRYYPYYYSYP